MSRTRPRAVSRGTADETLRWRTATQQDDTARDTLAQALRDKALEWALARGFQSADAEDVAQEATIQTLYRLATGVFRHPRYMWSWHFRATTHLCCDIWRKAELHRRTLAHLPWCALRRMVATDAHCEQNDRAASVRRAIRSLPALARQATELRYYHALSVAHIAAMVGATTGAIKVRLARARERLRRLLSAPL
jgi:RNA polymerase sigma-70 factor (ECF subfamily)